LGQKCLKNRARSADGLSSATEFRPRDHLLGGFELTPRRRIITHSCVDICSLVGPTFAESAILVAPVILVLATALAAMRERLGPWPLRFALMLLMFATSAALWVAIESAVSGGLVSLPGWRRRDLRHVVEWQFAWAYLLGAAALLSAATAALFETWCRDLERRSMALLGYALPAGVFAWALFVLSTGLTSLERAGWMLALFCSAAIMYIVAKRRGKVAAFLAGLACCAVLVAVYGKVYVFNGG
jgi:hypothetical protein